MTGMLRGGRAEYRRWDGEEEQLIEKIERKLGIGVIVTNVALIAGFFFFAAGGDFLSVKAGKILCEFGGRPANCKSL